MSNIDLLYAMTTDETQPTAASQLEQVETAPTGAQTTDLASECREVKPVVLRPEDVEHIAASLSDQDLLEKVKSGLHNFRDNLPYLRQARDRFAKPGQRLPVSGNPTWTQWVTENLGVSIRTVQRALEEPKAKKGKKPRQVKPLKDWPQAQRRINDLLTAIQRLQTKTSVQGSDMLVPALKELATIAGCQLIEPPKPPKYPEPSPENFAKKTKSKPVDAKPEKTKTKAELEAEKKKAEEKAKQEAQNRARRVEIEASTDAFIAPLAPYGTDENGKPIFLGKQ
jgi:hypothetical protein